MTRVGGAVTATSSTFRRLLGPLLTLIAACALLVVARWMWAHQSIPVWNVDPTARYAATFLTLTVAIPAATGALLAIVALYLRLRKHASKNKADTVEHD